VDDSAINFAETTASSIRESFDIAVDTAFILGDGTSTYGNHLGLANITGTGNIVANTGAGNSWSALTVANFLDTMASIKNANEERCHWLFTKEFYYSVCMKLDKAASQFRQLVGPPPAGFNGWFLDKPVKFIPSISGMPTATGSAQRCAYYGDFVGAVTMGLRSDIGIEFSDQAYWSSDLVAWKATARCHVNIHGSGRSTSNIAYLVTT
jgi:HK97 family phage major capsid protein